MNGARRPRAAPVQHKRQHRHRLSQRADRHWKRLGHRERVAYLDRVRRALASEGFRHTPFQWRHKGHAFGLVKDLRDRQIHVRVYENGIVDAEVEISRHYLQHLYSPRASAHRIVQRIFRKHRIPLEFVNEHYVPRVGAHRNEYPKRRTKMAHVLGGAAGLVGGVVAVSFARFVLRRLRS